LCLQDAAQDAGIALKEVVPTRKAFKVRMIVEILRPLLATAAKRLVLGLFNPALQHEVAT
jgi:anthranilate phosphoribosyltransferase